MESNEENKKKQSNGINSSDPKIVEQEGNLNNCLYPH